MSFIPYVPLSARHYGFPEKFLTIEGHRLCYVDAGTGPAVLFLHGLGASIGRWRDTLQEFAKSHRVIAYDHLGFGKSDKPNLPYSIPLFTKTLREVVRQLHLHNFYLVGHSMGGGVVLDYLTAQPQNVQGAMVVTPAGVRLRHPLWQRIAALLLLRGGLAGPLLRRLIASTVYVHNETTNEMIAFAASLPKDPEWRLFKRSCLRSTRALLGYSVREKLHGIRVPLSIVWGERDTLQSPQLALDMHQRIPSAQLTIIPECGHFPMLERPEEFHKVLHRFLTDQNVPYESCEGHGH